MKLLTEKPRYVTFSNSKDRALEALLYMTRAKCADVLREFIAHVQTEIGRTYPFLNLEIMNPHTMAQLHALDKAIDRHAYTASLLAATHWIALKAHVFALSQAGQQQAIIQTKDGQPHKISRDDIQSAAYASTEWGPASDRCYLSFSRLRRDVMDKVEMSRILKNDLVDCIQRVLSVFPVEQNIKRPKVLATVKEAGLVPENDGFGLSDFLDQSEWDDIVDSYKKEFIPKWRDPRKAVLPSPVSVGNNADYVVYPWQLEQEMTSDFVYSVRSGEHRGANKQGITDFVWIAVLGAHGKTGEDACQYCRKRDGLTITEIEDKLNGEWSDDPEWSRKSAVPLHPYCFCRLAPAADNLPDMPDTGAAEFEEWLST